MFRKLNKPQLTKIKQQNFIGIRAFDSRSYLDISSVPNVHLWSIWFVKLRSVRLLFLYCENTRQVWT
jgi:hypothetical protein